MFPFLPSSSIHPSYYIHTFVPASHQFHLYYTIQVQYLHIIRITTAWKSIELRESDLQALEATEIWLRTIKMSHLKIQFIYRLGNGSKLRPLDRSEPSPSHLHGDLPSTKFSHSILSCDLLSKKTSLELFGDVSPPKPSTRALQVVLRETGLNIRVIINRCIHMTVENDVDSDGRKHRSCGIDFLFWPRLEIPFQLTKWSLIADYVLRKKISLIRSRRSTTCIYF